MVESRNLCDFEKSVLLALIGSVIQPSKFGTHVNSNCSMIGELLRIFCSNLEEQIAHRRYFYKSASLVREGMVTVHSSVLSGDPTSAIVSSIFCVIVYMFNA